MDKQKILDMALEQAKKIPGDIVKSGQAAVNISPPVDMMRRVNTNGSYLPYGGVPYEEQVGQNMQNIKDALQAMHLVGYAAPLRMFTSNPLELKAGEQAVRLSTGKGWEVIDKLLNR